MLIILFRPFFTDNNAFYDTLFVPCHNIVRPPA